jgi:hypothetical protein
MTHISNKTRERLSETLNSVNVQAILNDLTIDRMMQFGVNTRVEIFWCTMDPKSKKRLEKQLNDKTEEFINPFSLRNAIQELHDQGALRIENCLVSPPDGKRLYRIELGRYCDDFDEFGNECFREMRFSEIKMSRREDLL